MNAQPGNNVNNQNRQNPHPPNRQQLNTMTINRLALPIEYNQEIRLQTFFTKQLSHYGINFSKEEYADRIQANVNIEKHEHQNLAAARRYNEIVMMKKLRIINVGQENEIRYYEIACSKRSTYPGLPIWYSRPLITEHDRDNYGEICRNLGRNPVAPQLGFNQNGTGLCTCAADECEHIGNKSMISTDVLYYAHKRVFKELIRHNIEEIQDTRSLHIIHIPIKERGYLYGDAFKNEGSIEVVQDNRDFQFSLNGIDYSYRLTHGIDMRVKGNYKPHIHEIVFQDLAFQDLGVIEVTGSDARKF